MLQPSSCGAFTPVARCIQIGLEGEGLPVIGNIIPRRVKGIYQLHNGQRLVSWHRTVGTEGEGAVSGEVPQEVL